MVSVRVCVCDVLVTRDDFGTERKNKASEERLGDFEHRTVQGRTSTTRLASKPMSKLLCSTGELNQNFTLKQVSLSPCSVSCPPVNIVCGKLGKEPPPVPGNRSPPSLEEEGSDSESDSEDDISEDDRQDPTYSPDEGDTDSSGEDSADESEELNITGEAADPVAEPKFIVPLSRLLQLLAVWKAEQAQLVQGLQGKTLCLAGDGRADSPGYSAKYGTYSLMEMNLKRIIHFELVQSTEVKPSSHMEKEGLRRGLDNLLNEGLIVGTLVTDRHIGVKAMMTTDYPNTKHRFDAWHLAKGKAILEVIFETKGRQMPCLARHYWCRHDCNY
ncbi:uncharacterized protein ISCGN_010093 [Ixodes scapularis]